MGSNKAMRGVIPLNTGCRNVQKQLIVHERRSESKKTTPELERFSHMGDSFM